MQPIDRPPTMATAGFAGNRVNEFLLRAPIRGLRGNFGPNVGDSAGPP